jgi:acyl dehydratase
MPELHYFEDFAVGQIFRSKSIQVDRDRMLAFAREFDPQPQHLDEAGAAATHFGQLVASGWYTAAVSMRLFVENLPPIAGGSQGVGVDGITWSRPVRAGDVLWVETEVTAVRLSRSRPDKGLVTIRDRTFNQDGEVVQTMSHTFMAPRRGAEARNA